jgi:hypothetical protein
MSIPDVTVYPYWDAPHQQFANDQVARHHQEAIRRFGEYSAWVMRWNTVDYEAGNVALCSPCIPNEDHWRVYGQVTDPDCPDCLGTTYEGGVRAVLIRPTMWDYPEEENSGGRRGEVITQTAEVQTTNDFRARVGDWVLQHNNVRWQVQGIRDTKIHTGFIGTTRYRNNMGYGYSLVREDPDSVIYDHIMTPEELAAMDERSYGA